MYAKVENGSIAKYPFSHTDFRYSHPKISFPKQPLERADIRSEYGVVVVKPIPKPSQEGYTVVEGSPVIVNDEWEQSWELIEMSYEAKRKEEYGPVENQIEFITENGLEAWQTQVSEIKARHPKPVGE